MTNRCIGRVTATENAPTSCDSLQFWVDADVILKPFDIVRVEQRGRDPSETSHTYAIVTGLSYITDSASHLANYVSADFGDVSQHAVNKRMGTAIAFADVLYNNAEIEMPVVDGAAVEWADEEGIREALGINSYRYPIPAGYIRTSNGIEVPVDLEADYLLGPEGAHLNIAGISGLATKTSYAMFLLSSVQQRRADQVSMIIFNVKGQDLLAINEPNDDLTEAQRLDWTRCGLDPVPFRDVRFLYPYSRSATQNHTTSHVSRTTLERQKDQGIARNYYYDVQTAIPKLSYLFADVDDSTSTMQSIAAEIAEWEDISEWSELFTKVANRTKSGSGQDKSIAIASWRKFNRILTARSKSDLFCEKSIINQKEERQETIEDAVSSLRGGQVLVIDIEPLPDHLQRLVFGDVIKTIYGIKLNERDDVLPDDLGHVIIFADELNKYAPGTSGANTSSLTANILEVTERGRSLGTVLFGAEQFRTGVHDRVLGNCSTNVYGRTSPVEIAKCPDYKYFPNTYKNAVTRLPKGTLLLQHALFRAALIKVSFPFPCYYQPK